MPQAHREKWPGVNLCIHRANR